MNLKKFLPISSVFNGDFEIDGDLTGDMKFKNLLFACKEYTELFEVKGDLGDDISLVAQSKFSSRFHPKKQFFINLFSRISF